MTLVTLLWIRATSMDVVEVFSRRFAIVSFPPTSSNFRKCVFFFSYFRYFPPHHTYARVHFFFIATVANAVNRDLTL